MIRWAGTRAHTCVSPDKLVIMNDELVVLADASGRPCGTTAKATVHTTQTPFHLAFSCYLLDASGRVLLTRRALNKQTWPGVWTNTACGHLAPGETALQACERRVPEELGLTSGQLGNLRLVLPEFQYRAVDSSGIVEWEWCPVFVGSIAREPAPIAEEVDQHAWAEPAALFRAVDATPFAFSPWMVEQLSSPALRMALREVRR